MTPTNAFVQRAISKLAIASATLECADAETTRVRCTHANSLARSRPMCQMVAAAGAGVGLMGAVDRRMLH
jgi:hypothetical protein